MTEINAVVMSLEHALTNQFFDIPPATLSILQDLDHQGVILGLTSSRSLKWMRRYLKSKGISSLFSFLIGSNGCQYLNLKTGASINRNPLTKKDLETIVKNLNNIQLACSVPYCRQLYFNHLTWRALEYAATRGRKVHFSLEGLPDDAVFKKIFIVGSPAALAKFEQNIEKESGFSFASLFTSITGSVKNWKDDGAGGKKTSDKLEERKDLDPDDEKMSPAQKEAVCQNLVSEFQLDGRPMVFLHPKPWVTEISSASINMYTTLEYAMDQFHLQPQHILYFGVSDKDNPVVARTYGIAMKGSPVSTSNCARRTTKYNGAQNGIGYMINVLKMDRTCVFCAPDPENSQKPERTDIQNNPGSKARPKSQKGA